MKEKRRHIKVWGWLLAGFYLAAALIWGLCSAANAVQGLLLYTWQPAREDFRLEGIREREEPYGDYDAPLVSTDADPKLIYRVPVTVSSVAFTLRGHLPTGTPALYYKKTGEAAYHALYPTGFDPASGEYVFQFDALNDVELRLDPVTTPGCIFELSDLRFNVPRPLWRYWIPSLDKAVLLALCPLLAFAAVREAASLFKKPHKDKEESLCSM